MTDMLLELGKSAFARKLVANAGLPIPMPEKLERPSGPSHERFLEGKTVLVAGDGALGEVLAQVLVRAGATPCVGSDALSKTFAGPAEAYGRPTRVLTADDATAEEKVHALVLDATRVSEPYDLKLLYDFFHTYVRRLARSGRAIVLGRLPETAGSLGEAAARNALEGFTRSLAKEIGGKGATANLVLVADGAEARLPGVLRFFLSSASAFVSAQPLRVTADAASTGDDPWEKPLAGKVALVTGAARGIGAATAHALAADGAHVVCLDRPEDDAALSQVATAIGGSALLADVSDREAGSRIANELLQRHRGVDIVVHNAGITRDRTIARMSESQWDLTLGVNLDAVVRITEALLQGALHDHGRIVSLSSISGIAGNMGQSNYAASKAGVIGFTRYLSRQVRTRGITVNAIAPGFIETRMTAAIPLVVREAGRRLSALGQGGQPEDVAHAIRFLSTPGAAGVTGQVLRVCGGALIGA